MNFRIGAAKRGLKRCSSCGKVSGQRALICMNEDCELRQKILAARRPFDPVQLVSLNGTALYSLRSKDRDAHPRNFVQITEVTLALELHSTILSRNTLCYTCMSYASDATGIACKHVKACSSDPSKPLHMAECYTITREVLWNLNISTEQKNRLWEMYKADEEVVPAVQRINATTFVVKCAQLTKVFPAGRLHVTAVSNAVSQKKGTHACACKKLKIIVEPDNSVVMQEEICDHLLLVLAAILSKSNGKTVYGNFTSALKSFWMPASLETPVVDASQEDAFYINIGGNFGDAGVTGEASADDIFIFGDEFLSDDNIPDFSDIILDLTPTDTALPAQMPSTANTSASADMLHPGDPNLVSSCCDITEEDGGIQFNELSAAATVAGNGTIASTHLELSDCNIELMDQFQLTDQIDLCSDDILPPASTELFDGNSISILAPPLASDPMAGNSGISISTPATQQLARFNRASLLKTSNQILPPIEMPTIAVVKKCPVVKASAIVTEVKTRQFPAIPAKRALIVNSPSSQTQLSCVSAESGDGESEPSLAYSVWLEYVVETINESVAVVDQTDIVHKFHVHEEIFSHFSKSFSVGVKRRMPNFTTTVKKGKYKGLIKYTWYFGMSSTVRRIFSTKNISLEIERAFECNKEGVFVPYVGKTYEKTASKHKLIYPKLALYMASIGFDNSNQHHKTGLKLEWLPNAFPKSNFGILNIEFSLGIKHPKL